MNITINTEHCFYQEINYYLEYNIKPIFILINKFFSEEWLLPLIGITYFYNNLFHNKTVKSLRKTHLYEYILLSFLRIRMKLDKLNKTTIKQSVDNFIHHTHITYYTENICKELIKYYGIEIIKYLPNKFFTKKFYIFMYDLLGDKLLSLGGNFLINKHYLKISNSFKDKGFHLAFP
jgi:hypothetical protein